MNELNNQKSTGSSTPSPKVYVVITIIILAFGGFYYFRENTVTQSNANSPVTRTFNSSKLGVRFTYADQDLDKKILVQESGDTIFVYLEGTIMEDGQSVQVFSKEPNTSLNQAIQDRFLRGYDRSECFVQSGMDANGSRPATGIAAIIAYPISEANDAWLMNAAKCPAGYSLTNGLSYFWIDRENSDTFVFFSIGQYYIPASSVGTSWHTTLEFIEPRRLI